MNEMPAMFVERPEEKGYRIRHKKLKRFDGDILDGRVVVALVVLVVMFCIGAVVVI